MLLNGRDEIVTDKVLGTTKVRGIKFHPTDPNSLVAMLAGAGPGVPSTVFRLAVPALTEQWKGSVGSPTVSLEKGTPDKADAFAVSGKHVVLHSAGECNQGEWCAGHQGSITQVVDMSTGNRIGGNDWQASHSTKQMISYNPRSDVFLMADAGDAYPKALLFSVITNASKSRTQVTAGTAEFATWGNEGGKQGMTQGAIAASKMGTGFGATWSVGPETGAPDKLFFARFGPHGEYTTAPKRVFGGSGTEIGSGCVALGNNRWLVTYTASYKDVVKDYLRIFSDDWGVPADVRAHGGRAMILDDAGEVQGSAVDVSAHGAPVPVEINNLVERADGVGWIYVEPSRATVKVVTLRCKHSQRCQSDT